MVICFECMERTKQELDQLLGTGRYRDYTEAISVAVSNQVLLEGKVNGAGALLIPPVPSDSTKGVITSKEVALGTGQAEPHPKFSWTSLIPGLFTLDSTLPPPAQFGTIPNDAFVVGQEIPVDRWIFGQHNKLLPVKASCRALANLLAKEPKGIPVATVGSDIAQAAAALGDHLRGLDDSSRASRDEALATAFPFGDSDGYKARLRFANQFVAGLNKNNQLSGLLADFKLVNLAHSKEPRLLLTEPGWRLAKLRNPVLDNDEQPSGLKLSAEERDLLLAHIDAFVPVEQFAIRTILTALAEEAVTPESLDTVLRKHVSSRAGNPISKAFVSTQRSGVISRMVDLGLIARVRDGLRVTYRPTERALLYAKAFSAERKDP